MTCEACGASAPSLKTVRWRTGERRFVLCDGCHVPLAGSLWVVPGEHTVNAKCQVCGSYSSLGEMATLSPGAGKRDFGGVCAGCSGGYG